MKKLDEKFKYQSTYLSKVNVTEHNFLVNFDMIKELYSIEKIFQDKRYRMFKDDLIFIVNQCNDPKILTKLMSLSFLFSDENKIFKNSSTFKEFTEKLYLN